MSSFSSWMNIEVHQQSGISSRYIALPMNELWLQGTESSKVHLNVWFSGGPVFEELQWNSNIRCRFKFWSVFSLCFTSFDAVLRFIQRLTSTGLDTSIDVASIKAISWMLLESCVSSTATRRWHIHHHPLHQWLDDDLSHLLHNLWLKETNGVRIISTSSRHYKPILTMDAKVITDHSSLLYNMTCTWSPMQIHTNQNLWMMDLLI